MESVKKSVKNFGKGFGIWLILLLLNTRAGESSVNGIKIKKNIYENQDEEYTD